MRPGVLATAPAVFAAIALAAWWTSEPDPAPGTETTAAQSESGGQALDASPNASANTGGSIARIDPASIAVLPFADLSPEGDQEYFSDGIAEEILNALVQVGDLKVASRTSSFAFKGQESTSLRTIADALSVKHLLEGSVRKAGQTLRITVQLIDATTDRHLWSETFDRPMTTESVFAVQGEIAAAVVRELGVIIGPTDAPEIRVKAPTHDLSAYDLYLEARSLYQNRIRIDEASVLLAEAIERDPDFVDAWALRVAVFSLFREYSDSELTAEELNAIVDDSAARTLALDPDNALAIAARANFRSQATMYGPLQFNVADILKDLERAVALDPRDSSAMNWLGLTYMLTGEHEKTLSTFETCVSVDPLFGPCAENLYDQLVTLGRYDEAWERFQSVLAKGMVIHGWVNFALLAHFDEKTAFMMAANSETWLPRWRRQDEIYAAFKDPDGDHSALAADLTAYVRANSLENRPYINMLLAAVGAYDTGPPFVAALWGRNYAAYRRTPQFKAFMNKSDVPDYWRTRGFPPQCKPLGENDFECQ